jgi:AraC-like DNA-binding protein
MTIDRRHTNPFPPSLLDFMALNATHAELDVPGLPAMASGAADGITRDQERRAKDVALVYRRFASALNRHVYLQNERDAPPPFDEYELLCYCMVSADTLRNGIGRAMKFVSALNGRGGTLMLSTHHDKAVLSCEVGWTHRSTGALSLDMLALIFYSKFFSWLIAEPLADLELSFSHRALLDPAYLQDLMPCRSRYEADRTLLAFDAALLSRPIVKTQYQLADMLARGPIEFLPIAPTHRIAGQVEALLRRALLEQRVLPTIDRVGSQLGKSGSTLRRRLTAEGVSFQSLVDACRRDRARELLASTQMTVDEIALQVGFSERSAFSHAFKSWIGQTPSAYRDEVTRDRFGAASAA